MCIYIKVDIYTHKSTGVLSRIYESKYTQQIDINNFIVHVSLITSCSITKLLNNAPINEAILSS